MYGRSPRRGVGGFMFNSLSSSSNWYLQQFFFVEKKTQKEEQKIEKKRRKYEKEIRVTRPLLYTNGLGSACQCRAELESSVGCGEMV
jgi:hypothetical protein